MAATAVTEPIYGPVHGERGGGSGGGSGDGPPRPGNWRSQRMRRSAGPKVAGTTHATTIVARRDLGDVTAGTLSPRGKRGEVKNPPLLKPWSLLHL